MRMFPAVAIAALLAAPAFAQEFVVTQSPKQVPIVAAPKEMPPKIEGIVKQIFNVQKPWQLLNPNAPKQYGDGRNNVSYSEKDPGKPKGFILFALDW